MSLPTPRKIAKYGWKPDLPDQRDLILPPVVQAEVNSFVQWLLNLFSKKKPTPTPVNTVVDLRPGCPPIYDQGDLGSCTANAISAMFEFMQKKEGATPFMPSRLFVYYNERAIEGTTGYDAGAYIRDGMKVINKQGVCKESTWPYLDKQLTVKPSAAAYAEGLNNQSLQYLSVNQTLADLQKCLSDGYPFVFGFTVYESFESQAVATTGIVPMPKKSESVLGGHAVMAVGFDAAKKMFLVRNSWGTGWGLQGYFWMPFDYVVSSSLSSDFWTLRKVEV